jgi:hypothetical protein
VGRGRSAGRSSAGGAPCRVSRQKARRRERLVAQPAALPEREVGVLQRQRGQRQRPAGAQRLVPGAQLAQEDAERPAVGGDVVPHQDQPVIVRPDGDDGGAQQQPVREAERQPRDARRDARRRALAHRRRQRREVDRGQRQAGGEIRAADTAAGGGIGDAGTGTGGGMRAAGTAAGRGHRGGLLRRLAAGRPEDRPQRLVPLDDRGERARQRRQVERPAETQQRGDVVHRIPRRELMQEP